MLQLRGEGTWEFVLLLKDRTTKTPGDDSSLPFGDRIGGKKLDFNDRNTENSVQEETGMSLVETIVFREKYQEVTNGEKELYMNYENVCSSPAI